jgi:hypothetical protein
VSGILIKDQKTGEVILKASRGTVEILPSAERSFSLHGVRTGAADAIAEGLKAYAGYRADELQRERTMRTMRAMGYGPDTLVLDVIPGGGE